MQNPSKDEIVHTDVLAAQMVKMYMNGDYADVLFVVENERIPAHRMFLAARSNYFRALLYGGLKESNQKEVKLSVRLKPFKYLLKYMYSGKLSLNHIKLEDILDTLGLTDVFNLSVLKTAISEYLCKVISLSNVCTVLNSAQIYALSGLISQCHSFMDVNATQVLKQETFRNISYQALISVLDRESFCASEIEIFQAVHNWCGFNEENADNIKNLYAKVRFTAMSQKELLTVVRGTNVLKPSELLDIINQKDSTDHLPFRGVVAPEQNVFKPGMWSSVTLHADHCSGEAILDKVYVINMIAVERTKYNSLTEHNIEVSFDGKTWLRVVVFEQKDFLHNSGRATKNIPPQAIRYIRITNRIQLNMRVVAAMFTTKMHENR